MNKNAPVAITGIGCLSASGNSLKDNMKALFSGKRDTDIPKRFSSSHPNTYPVFELKESITFLINDEQKHLSRTSQLGLAAATEAIEDAELDREIMSGLKVGVCIGTTVGSTMNDEQYYRDYRDNLDPEMFAIKKFLNSNPASAIARKYSLAGPCQTIVNACSSGTDAIGIGASWIRAGVCDIVIAGGADELSRISYTGFISLMITDEHSCKPFDRNRKGLNLGEGSAALILESKHSLIKRKKAPRAFVLGYGSACDGYHLTAPHPEGKGLRNALMAAFTDSGRQKQDIGFINAHGTATPDNDRAEAKVLKELLPDIPFLSTKGYTGHTLGAAGAIEAAFSVACLESGMIPANVGFIETDPELGVSPVKENTDISGKTAISESLAFGGHNSVLILSTEGI
jgi:3-oxoacyl-[acyl-carrier-protein] synthase II